MNTKISVAVIGCGYWGKNLIRNISEIGALAAVCDHNPDQAKKFAVEFGVAAKTLDQLLASDIHAVMIAAPAGQHFSLAKKLLLAGKDVFIEKPFTLKLADALELQSLAKNNKRCVMVGHLLQYHPAFRSLARLVQRGELGKINYISSSRLNFGHFRYDENILWDFAPHDLSMILALASAEPREVFASGACQVEPGAHDTVNLNINFADGLQAQVHVSRMHPYKEQKLIVVGSSGMAVFDDCLPWEDKLKVYQHKVTEHAGVPMPNPASAISIAINPLEPLKLECQHFVESVANRSKPRTDADEALSVIKVLHAAQQSLQNNEKTAIAQTKILATGEALAAEIG